MFLVYQSHSPRTQGGLYLLDYCLGLISSLVLVWDGGGACDFNFHITVFITYAKDAEEPGLALRSTPVKCERKIKILLF